MTEEMEEEIEEEPAILTLPQSHIVVTRGHVIKQSPDGRAIARHSVGHVSRVEARQKFSFFSVLVVLIGASLVYFPYTRIEGEVLKWILIVLGAFFALFGFAGTFSSILVLHCGEETVTYSINDDYENLKGFVVSANELLGR